MCECGHSLETHGDRALPPACESDRPFEPLHRVVGEMLLINVPRFHPDSICPCEGYRRG